MKFSLAALFVVLFAVGASAICQNSPTDHQFQFVTRGSVCDGTNPTAAINASLPITDSDRGCTRCCKNFQSCMPNGTDTTTFTCQEISQNMTCATVPEGVSPCGPYLECVSVSATLSQCFFPGRLGNGALCTVSEQCASGSCNFNGNGTAATCLPSKSAGIACVVQTDCPAGKFCNISGGTCVNPIGANQDCSAAVGTEDYNNYKALSTSPNYVCKAGNGCLEIPASKSGAAVSYKCTPYYQASKKGTVCYNDQWWNCEFGFFCNLTTATQGTCLITNQNGAIGDSCKYFPLSTSDQSECYWGTGCSCFTKNTNTTSSGQCQRMYNTNCQIQLNNLVNCIINNNCPHDAFQLIGGNGSPFASSTVVGSCIQTKCASQHANLIKCQNDIGNRKASFSSAYVPKTYPNNAYSDKENGLHGWEIGLIIVGVAVAIIIVVVIVVAVVRRKSSNGQYTPLE